MKFGGTEILLDVLMKYEMFEIVMLIKKDRGKSYYSDDNK
jgi:hypothetical protein